LPGIPEGPSRANFVLMHLVGKTVVFAAVKAPAHAFSATDSGERHRMFDVITLGESTRLAVLYAHLLASMLAIARVLAADVGLVTGRLSLEQMHETVRDIGLLLAALWATGLAIVWLDTGFEPAKLAMSSKLLLKLLAVSVLTLNGALLHRLSFPILLSDRAAGIGAASLLAVSGALSTLHWLLAAFVGVASPLARLPLENLLVAYALVVAATVVVAIGCVPMLQRSGILMQFVPSPEKREASGDGCDVGDRDRFERDVQRTLSARRGRDTSDRLVVVALELDDVGSIVDRLGRAAGVQVFATVVERLRAARRDHDLIGHLGGGRFVLLLGMDADTDFVATVKRLRSDVVREPVVTLAGPCRIDVAIGMAVHDARESFEHVLDRAHGALASGRVRAQQPCRLAPPLSWPDSQRACVPGIA